MLDIATDRNAEARILVIHLRGRIDALTAREFDEFFEDLLRGGERVFILRGNHLEAISSAGIGSLVKFVRRLRGLGGGAVFVRLPEEIRLLLDFFGLGELLPVFDDVDSANAHLQSSLVRFKDSLEIKREATLRARVRPEQNAAAQHRRVAKPAPTKHHTPDVYARPIGEERHSKTSAARSYVEHAHTGRVHAVHERQSDSFHDSDDDSGPTESELEVSAELGPTESELEVSAELGPTESELEIMSEAGPTDSELEIMSESGPTESEREVMSGSSSTDSEPEVRYEQALLHKELADADEDGELDDDLALDRERFQDEEHGAGGVAFSSPQVMACEQCGLNLRIFKSGLHMCPACGIEFDVGRDGRVSFYEKL